MKTVTLDWKGGKELSIIQGQCGDLEAKELMLLALARCSALTALAMFDKMRVNVTGFTTEISGRLTEPAEMAYSRFEEFTSHFSVTCPDPSHVQGVVRALSLTHDKYCGVGQMMRMIGPVLLKIEVNRFRIM